MAGALAGVRVPETGLLVQGPQAAAMLANMGADVIKIELRGPGPRTSGERSSRRRAFGTPSCVTTARC